MNNTINQADLRQFTGSETRYRHVLVRDMLYTEGAQFLAERTGAYWLLDEIALAQRAHRDVAAEPFQMWTLTVDTKASAVLACGDGNGKTVWTKAIPFTDFPLDRVALYVCDKTILLPSEY